MTHSHHAYREHQAAHRRVNHILKGEPSGAKQHADGSAFSKVTSKTAAEQHDASVSGKKSPKRYARGGKVKGHHQTNISIVVPGAKGGPGAGPMLGGAPPVPGGPPMPPPVAGPGMPPGAPGMPMRASGGRIKKANGGAIDGESTKGDIKKWGNRAKDNSYFRGGAASGVGREEKAEHKKRK